MNIVEHHTSIVPDVAVQIQQVFFKVFDEATDEDFLERVNEKADLTVLLAYDDEELVGFKIGHYLSKGIYRSWLGGVVQNHRGKGIAKALLERQHLICIEKGYSQIQTQTNGKNTSMLILNLKEGFHIFGSHLGHNDELHVQLRKFL